MNYSVLVGNKEFERFVNFLPDLEPNEVYYMALFARHKYCPNVPNIKDNQLARFTSTKETMREHILRLECSIGGYQRGGIDVPQEALALYIAVNPRNIVQANKTLLVELATRFANDQAEFNPITLAKSAVHNATNRKVFVDFDYDEIEPKEHLPAIKELLPANAYRVLVTRGGFHLLVTTALACGSANGQWYPKLAALKGCDVRGSGNMIPVPGCTQGDYMPYLMETPVVPNES